MTNLIALYKPTFKTVALMIVAAAVLAVTLPQLFHIVEIASGLGPALGAAFLPMQLPGILL